MEINVNNLMEQITSFLEKEAKTESIVGKEFKIGEFSCVPVIRVGAGLGSGGGEGSGTKEMRGEAGGAGVGVAIEPIGFLVSKGEQISFLGAEQNKGLISVFEKVPGLIEKYLETTAAKRKEPAMA